MGKDNTKKSFWVRFGEGFVKVIMIIGRAIKEFFRKRMVALKRRPQNIPLLLLVISFFVYSLNTSAISDTTNTLLGKNMGFTNFVTMLSSILVFVVFLDAFPKRQKPKIVMLVILYAMFAVMVVCDFYYANSVMTQVAKFDENIMETSVFIAKALRIVRTHAVLIIIEAILVATLPIYSRLFNMVKTSIDVEDNGAMGEIDITEE